MKVGMFDGYSFKRIKRAKIDGIADFRDKLTAVWFEILDLGGKMNNSGLLSNNEIAFVNYEDIAIALDRTEKEIELCINFYVENKMIEIIDDIFLIANWAKHQNVDGMEKIRKQNRIRQERFRNRQKKLAENAGSNVTITLNNAPRREEELEEELELEENREDIELKSPPTLPQIQFLFTKLNLKSDPTKFFNHHNSKQWIRNNGENITLENLEGVAMYWENQEEKFNPNKTNFSNNNGQVYDTSKYEI